MQGETHYTNAKPFYKHFLLIGIIFVLLIIVSIWIFLQHKYPTTSPLKTVSYFLYGTQHPHKQMTNQTIAFLPYWRITDTRYTRFDLLSEINYFSLTVTSDGNFKTFVKNQTEPGWLHWNSQEIKDLIAKTQITGSAFTLTIALQKNKDIESLLKSQHAQQILINNIVEQVITRRLNGITIDFEYDGKPDEQYRNAFTQFSLNLSSSLHQKAAGTSLSLTLLPLAGREKGLFDLPKLASYFEKFIGMSYDYYAQGSDIAGPVAPMYGFKDNKYFFDVVTTYEDYQKFLPKQKLIMGIPYYGYDWAVKNGKKIQSETLSQEDPNSYQAVMSYGRMREDRDIKKNQCTWDDYAQEEWCWYKDRKNIEHQVWVEDNRSIQVKYAFAKKNSFAGVAIWTLGYDKNYPDLWNIMEDTFRQ